MTAWYVRPDTSHSATRNGTEYDKAWGGWAAIVWGGAGVKAGDTLYVCGAHVQSAIIAPGAHGATVNSRVTIRGDYELSPGIVLFENGTYYLNVNRNYTTITNLPVKAGNYACIVLGGAPLTGVHIRNNELSAGGAITAGSLLRFQAFAGWSYIDCIIDGNAFSGGAGSVGGSAIQWYATAAASVTSLSNLQISNNAFTNCTGGRAVVQLEALNNVGAGTTMADITVAGNTFTDCSAVMIDIYGSDKMPGAYGRNTGIKVIDNIIRNQTEAGGFGGGIVLGGFGPSLTSGFGSNIVARNKAYELNGISGFVNLFYGTYRIFKNFADGISTATIDGNGILFDHGCDNCEAFGNEFHNIRGTGADNYYSGGFGILVLDATNCKAYGNVIDGCVTGVAFGNIGPGQSSDIFNNTFRNCSQSGAYVGAADLTSNLVRNNVFTAARGAIPAVKNFAGIWKGESRNCFHGFSGASGHTLHTSTVTLDPGLDDNYRPRTPYIKVGGTYLGESDFYGNQFSDPAPMGAVNDEAVIALSEPQQTELQKAVARPVYFVQLEFASSTQYVCTSNQTITWGGRDWLGFGMVGGISPVEESEGVESRALTFALNVADQSVLALAVGNVEEYRGKIAKMYFSPLNEAFQLAGTPQLCWRGLMDLMVVGIEGEEGQITLKCETSAYGLKRQPALRLNSAQHKKNYPNDTGLDGLTGLIANPVVWLSKKFQRSIN
ncbi:right-handed parallel beta-helix repeat-containing protein [Nitrosospira sp. Nsp1]|uniref:right-handed parallel beta-helix repeat-containing protein n=1 Tax=Nitrosospira sp. Nsp1 TaxID=136547 RepID=UPI0008859AA4|nr:right-handed parallel beta-helix repeat-containing protein [Nitrosospira sp. Nsp1]SCX40475.1 Right handed beta helix region [Nitrosospira sp. Nsp1]